MDKKIITFKNIAGPDPNFPYLDKTEYFPFSNSNKWKGDIVAVGYNLSPGMLLSAYEQGIFPWYNDGDPVKWQSPDPRCLIFPDTLHISSSMQKILSKHIYNITFNKNFSEVIKGCAQTKRPKQNGTWISNDIINAYTEIHHLGWVYSAEAWQDNELAGGCYGVLMGKAFFGESMFSKKSNASKAAFITLAKLLFENGIAFIDCQVPLNHLISLGGKIIARKDFLKLLKLHGVYRQNKMEVRI